jgi:hypothetical protein
MSSNNSTLTLRYPAAQAPTVAAQPQQPETQASEQNYNKATPVNSTSRLHTGNLLSRGNAPQTFSSQNPSLQSFTPATVSTPSTSSQQTEDDEDNYMRTNGYVEDGAGNGDKEEDTMLAQLADGEFVTRTDGVLGAGILAGANPKNAKEMRKLGAEFFYEQQRRFKRIYDLLDASRKATAN